MAITVAQNSDHKSLTGKTLTVQSQLTSRLRTAIVDVTYGGSDNYATNGNTVDLSMGGRISTVMAVEIFHVSTGLLLQYEPAAAGASARARSKGCRSPCCRQPL